MHDGEPLFPFAPKTRSVALRLQALAGGILDAAILGRENTVGRCGVIARLPL